MFPDHRAPSHPGLLVPTLDCWPKPDPGSLGPERQGGMPWRKRPGCCGIKKKKKRHRLIDIKRQRGLSLQDGCGQTKTLLNYSKQEKLINITPLTIRGSKKITLITTEESKVFVNLQISIVFTHV